MSRRFVIHMCHAKTGTALAIHTSVYPLLKTLSSNVRGFKLSALFNQHTHTSVDSLTTTTTHNHTHAAQHVDHKPTTNLHSVQLLALSFLFLHRPHPARPTTILQTRPTHYTWPPQNHRPHHQPLRRAPIPRRSLCGQQRYGMGGRELGDCGGAEDYRRRAG